MKNKIVILITIFVFISNLLYPQVGRELDSIAFNLIKESYTNYATDWYVLFEKYQNPYNCNKETIKKFNLVDTLIPSLNVISKSEYTVFSQKQFDKCEKMADSLNQYKDAPFQGTNTYEEIYKLTSKFYSMVSKVLSSTDRKYLWIEFSTESGVVMSGSGSGYLLERQEDSSYKRISEVLWD